jgi:hypothetical protein
MLLIRYLSMSTKIDSRVMHMGFQEKISPKSPSTSFFFLKKNKKEEKSWGGGRSHPMDQLGAVGPHQLA